MDGTSRRTGIKSASRPATPQDASGEQRFAPRRGDRLPAQIYFDGAVDYTPCLILDMSTTGARLEMRNGWDKAHREIHDGVERALLFIRQDKVMYECKLVRKGDKEVGVKFLSMPKPIPAPRNGR
ncbi:MAG: PilZ domain-containing protein [Hyphomicrobium sp.]